MEYLSNIELYFSENISNGNILVEEDEFLHITRVMRHRLGDKLHLTDGKGNIYSGKIIRTDKNSLEVKVNKTLVYNNNLEKVFFCIPALKNTNRFEFALEKSVELGITNFLIFESDRTVSKSKKIDRWNKILNSAMKQSLRSFLPKLETVNNFQDILNLEGNKFIFEQKSDKYFSSQGTDLCKENYFVFGPEGGLTLEELKLFNRKDFYKLAENRLRTETAVIKCASILTA